MLKFLQNGKMHVKDLAANAARYLTCVWPFFWTLGFIGLTVLQNTVVIKSL